MSWWPGVAVTAVLGAGYLAAVVTRPAGLRRWSRWRTAAWLLGAVLVGAAVSPPVAALAQHDHRAHMLQHLLLGMYAPLALVVAAPVTLALGSLPRRGRLTITRTLRSRPVHLLSHPVTAALLNVGSLFVLYLTPLYDLTRRDTTVHALLMIHLLLAGSLYTWAIAGPDPAPHRPGTALRVAVLVVAAGAHAFLAKLLFARATDHAGHGGGAPAESAAMLMYYGGDLAEVLLVVMLLGAWYRRRAPRRRPATATPPAVA